MEPVVSNENTISFTSAPPVGAAAATFDFFDGEDASSRSSISSLAAAAAAAYKNINLKTN